jgi:hypothetical protein|tara:strand:- start:54 stop:479 length:426 start_codon:yes stop_codon:yes gene_type:complete|eukprot:GHVR01031478.1.p1 GENE.GHVR01031478.1~~GHVR01031478.1.p1  ORF type:complete len:142 (+),score=28.26 GHVR01031478.1:388-813(+)
MSFVTTTLRDTIVNAPAAGGIVTVKAIFDNDTADNLILNADDPALSGFANGCKLDLSRAWWALTQGTAAANTGDLIIKFIGSSDNVVALQLAGTGHYDGSAGLIKGTATNTTATSSDINGETRGTSGFVILEFKKDNAWTA